MKYFLLADVNLEASWPATIKVLAGLIGVLCVLSLIFGVAIQWKKLFGQKPPIQEALEKVEARIRSEIIEAHKRAISNSEEAKAQVADLRRDMDQKFKDLHEDRLRTQANINQAFRDIERGLGRVEGAQKHE